MILVDTSVMIDFLKNNCTSATEKLNLIIQNGIPYGINTFIYQELLQGTSRDKDYNRLKTYLDSQVFYQLIGGRASFASAA